MFKTFENLVDSAPQIIKDKLEDLKGLRERDDLHPEESTFVHIKIVVNRLIKTYDINLILAGLLHDICKYDVHSINEKTGQIQTLKHEEAAYNLIDSDTNIQNWIFENGGDIGIIKHICLYHTKFANREFMRKHKLKTFETQIINLQIWHELLVFTRGDNMLEEFVIEKQFLYKAYVKVDDNEIRKKIISFLSDLKGRDILFSARYNYGNIIIVNETMVTSMDSVNIDQLTDFIDCGDNIRLFKALAAVNNTDDYMQYFVTETDKAWVNLRIYEPKGSLELSLRKNRYIESSLIDYKLMYPEHKASKEELIEYFAKI